MAASATVLTFLLLGIALVAIANTLAFPRLGKRASERPLPLVSILLPARDEAETIGETVLSLLRQTYPRFEVVVLDDGSTDGTAEVARSVGRGDERLRLVHGEPLPQGWWGKPWACHQLSKHARGEVFVFTDADVRWEAGALSSVVGELMASNADLLTVWPDQVTVSWAERLVVPLMQFGVAAYLPVFLVHHVAHPWFASANGQCLVFLRRSYQRIGGHASVHGEVLEDILLARRVKRQGLRLRMANANGLLRCRMYRDWRSVRNGFAKSLLPVYGDSVPLALALGVLHVLLYLWPAVWLVLGFFWRGLEGWPQWPLAMMSLTTSIRALTAASTGQRVLDSVFMPVSIILVSRIGLHALWWRMRYGGPRWKGRTVRPRRIMPGSPSRGPVRR